jgi:hypothetical protein
MEVGHSFVREGEVERNAAMRAARYYMRQNPGSVFVSAKDKKQPGWFRIWRQA